MPPKERKKSSRSSSPEKKKKPPNKKTPTTKAATTKATAPKKSPSKQPSRRSPRNVSNKSQREEKGKETTEEEKNNNQSNPEPHDDSELEDGGVVESTDDGSKSELEESEQRKETAKVSGEGTKKRANNRPRLTDITMQKTGALKGRLSREVQHWPVEAKGYSNRNPKCQLHRYIAGIDIRRNVVNCKECHVALCASCYILFHTEERMVKYKGKLKEEFLHKWHVAQEERLKRNSEKDLSDEEAEKKKSA